MCSGLLESFKDRNTSKTKMGGGGIIPIRLRKKAIVAAYCNLQLEREQVDALTIL